MILLDTNVLSEFMRPAPAEEVMAWLDAQMSGQVWVCAVTRAEVELGVALMPDGQRKLGLQQAAEAMFAQEFVGRCLPFDGQAAACYARIVALRTRAGRPSVSKMRKLRPSLWRMAWCWRHVTRVILN